MRKILLYASLTFLMVQCKKQNELPDLAKDNDYEQFALKDRVCQLNQKVTILENTNFTIDDKNLNYFFSTEGYLISEIFFNEDKDTIQENSYLKYNFPLIQKQHITKDNFIVTQTIYDSLNNIKQIKKNTKNNQIIDEQKNTLVDNKIITEDYYTSGNSSPLKTIKIGRNNNEIKYKVFIQNNQILDSIVYTHQNNKVVQENHYNSKNEIIEKQKFTYTGNNITQKLYLDAKDQVLVDEKMKYNQNNQILLKEVYSAYDNTTYQENFEYNTNNKLIKQNTKLNGDLIITATYKYDDQNNLVYFDTSNLINKENLIKSYKYTYDKKGNWLTKDVSINNKPTYSVNREITYCN